MVREEQKLSQVRTRRWLNVHAMTREPVRSWWYSSRRIATTQRLQSIFDASPGLFVPTSWGEKFFRDGPQSSRFATMRYY